MPEPGKEIQRWADSAMYSAEPMEGAHPRVYLLMATPDPMGAIAAACMMYEGKVARTLLDNSLADDMRRHYWEQAKKTHLKAPLEFVDLHFMIEGVTRAFTHQMVRQRTAVYAQESLRFAVKEDMADAVALPPSLHRGEVDERAMEIWTKAVEAADEAYQLLVNMGVPAEDARGLLPHNVTTRLHYKTNLRNLLDHAGNRLCTQAQFEWRWVFNELVKAIHDYEGYGTQWNKWQFEHIATDNVFKPVCFELGHCPLTASFDRGCTIRGRVEEGEFDKIRPEEWMLDHAAARRES
jgi:flavin-dependent thymidylate synthase